MAVPVPVYRIDFNNDGDFGDASEDVTSRVIDVEWDRGANGVFSGEAVGAATLILSNDDGFLTDTNMLPGLPVHIYATFAATDEPRFFGYVKKWTPDDRNHTVKVQCYDVLRRMQKTDIVVPVNAYTGRSGRDMRIAVLEDFERGNRNLVSHNPSFETNTTGWSVTGGSITRTAGDNAPGGGSFYGAFVAAGSGNQLRIYARMAPIFFDGQTYRWSVYLKVAAGTKTVVIGLGTDFGAGTANNERTVTVTTTWTRFTVTYTMPSTVTASAVAPLAGYVETTGADTIRVDAAAITRGQALYPYADTGTGRWPNWVDNGGFEMGFDQPAGWRNAFHNFVTNGSFETNTTGWTGVTRIATDAVFGSACGRIAASGTATYPVTGTFVAGVQYVVVVSVKFPSFNTQPITLKLGSSGTPVDSGNSVQTTGPAGNWQTFTQTWTPVANRTDALVTIINGTAGDTLRIDGVAVYRVDGTVAGYVDSGIGGGAGSFVTTSLAYVGQDVKWGHEAGYVDTPATAGAGRVYDFNHYGSYFVAGQQYSISVWIKATSNMPYKIGIGSDKLDGTYDESTAATGTALAGVWTQVTLTWTPSADRSSAVAFATLLYVWQTDATARSFQTDGVRVIPGSTADDYEMTHWIIPKDYGEAIDQYATGAALSGSALSALATINRLAQARHFIRPTMASPWYEYVVIDRESFAALTSQETFTDDPTDVNGWDLTGRDIDEDQIRNIIQVSWVDGSDYYSDEDSVDAYGPLPGSAIDGSAFFADRTIPDDIGPAFIDAAKDPHGRPTLVVERRFPSQLQRELIEVITIDSARLGTTKKYLIVREQSKVDQSGQTWITKYGLEAFPY